MNPIGRRSRKKPMADINVVPYIDVMLVLLIVFMVTAPMMTQGVKVELPQLINSPLDTDDIEPLVVSVTEKGEYYIDLGEKRDQAQSLEVISDMVKKVLSSKPATPVLVNGDASVSYSSVIELMATLQRSGVSNVGLLTEPPE